MNPVVERLPTFTKSWKGFAPDKPALAMCRHPAYYSLQGIPMLLAFISGSLVCVCSCFPTCFCLEQRFVVVVAVVAFAEISPREILKAPSMLLRFWRFILAVRHSAPSISCTTHLGCPEKTTPKRTQSTAPACLADLPPGQSA